MNNPIISIIIPVWNAEKTLSTCISSILSQTLKDWEVILSDDGSTDSSLSICISWSKQDKRIKVIANPHQGVSATRNAALDLAKGKYICYIDSDDTVDHNYLELLYAHCEHDMVVCGYWVDIYDQNGVLINQEKHVQSERSYSITKKEELKALFASGFMHINCNKLLRNEIIKTYNLRYKPYPVNEDFIFMMEYLLHVNTLYVVEQPTYHWIRVENRVSGVESIPENIIYIYNYSHKLLQSFFTPNQQIADEIMYYSYEFIALKYIKSINCKFIDSKKGYTKLKELLNNNLVQASFKAHKPNGIGESILYKLLKMRQFKIYNWIISNY